MWRSILALSVRCVLGDLNLFTDLEMPVGVEVIRSCRSRHGSVLCSSLGSKESPLRFGLYLWSLMEPPRHSLAGPWVLCLRCKFSESTGRWACTASCTIGTRGYTIPARRHSLNPNNSTQRLFTWDMHCSLGYAFRNHTDCKHNKICNNDLSRQNNWVIYNK